MQEVVQKLRVYLLGWKAYFGLAQTPGIWRGLDRWIRRRLRVLQLKQWKTSRTIYRELMVLGASDCDAKSVAKDGRRWWYKSDSWLNRVLTNSYFDQLGVPRLI
jgi:RNA-directed DNA polymerase